MSEHSQSPQRAARAVSPPPAQGRENLGEPHAHKSNSDTIVAQTPFFDFYRAASPHRMAQVHQLRYEVYCEERGFLPAANYPDGEEHDEFDGASIHFVACHRTSGLAAGTARLVLASTRGLPMMAHCTVDEPHAFMACPQDPRLLYYGEVSRVAVSRRYAQRPGDTPFGGLPRANNVHPLTTTRVPDYPSTAGPEIVSGMYKSIYQEARLRGLSHLVAAMERSLVTLLRRMAIHFAPIGPAIDYYGPVRPYVAALSQMELDLLRQRPEVLRYWLSGLPPMLLPPIAPLVDAALADRDDDLADGAARASA